MWLCWTCAARGLVITLKATAQDALQVGQLLHACHTANYLSLAWRANRACSRSGS